MIFYAVTNNFLDKVPLDRVAEWQDGFLRYMQGTHPNIGRTIASAKKLDDDTTNGLKIAIQDFNQMFLTQK